MNVHTPDMAERLSAETAAAMVRRLRDWAATATADEIGAADPALAAFLRDGKSGSRDLSSVYPAEFRTDADYLRSLPDLQNGPTASIRGDRRHIQHVGIHGFRLPIRYHSRDGADLTLETSVTGTVSLEAEKKGINMSRIMRTFYAHAEKTFSLNVIEAALDDYKADLQSLDARLQMRFRYPMRVTSLRSGLEGFQFYDITLEAVERAGIRHRILHLDYVYSSTCPCSLELAEHARRTRGQLATPHSQRSVARISVVLAEAAGCLWFEDLVELCRAAVPTETQVMVKREDEQAFAELNAANPIFVEDAARLFARELDADPRIGDFRIAASHQESLHSHDAVSVLTEGDTFAQASLDPRLFDTLAHHG